ncbi:MAG: hypothetical protein NC411_06220 [Bacteroides sp.]|nr:hypothetical protein [Bacteroides sp.]
MTSFTRKILVILIFSMLTGVGTTYADKTLRGKLRTNKSLVTRQPANSQQPTAVYDTITANTQDGIKLSGYDKPLNSRKESLFVTNKLNRSLYGVEIHLTYTDLNGRMLHETTELIRAEIPAGTTRRIDFRSWDVQNSFYYYKSRKPKTSNVTPFMVACEVTRYISLSPKETDDTANGGD